MIDNAAVRWSDRFRIGIAYETVGLVQLLRLVNIVCMCVCLPTGPLIARCVGIFVMMVNGSITRLGIRD